ncbi:MAG: UDP-4-amino-4,6-dideoxy-N-acetyl-beta-L-altrosamine transaminase [Thermodesulfobacteriota bacterium]
MSKRPIAYGGQTIDGEDTRSVLEVLDSPCLTQGPYVEAFEEALARYTGARYAVACSSGTAALHLACLTAGITDGKRAVTVPNTFVATPNSILHAGGTPVFVDIDAASGAVDLEKLEEVMSYDVRAVIPVHYGGEPLPMEKLRVCAGSGDVFIIEDACHGLGARWRDSSGRWRMVGSCYGSDMTVFSFHPVKSITTGEGGAVTTNERGLYMRLKELRSHGITKTPSRGRHWPPWHYEMRSLGFNYRISDIQCALGLAQLKKIGSFMKRRREIAALYGRLFSGCGDLLKTPFEPQGCESAWHLYPIRIDFKGLGINKQRWFALMLEKGIALQVHYIPVHLQPYYKRRFGYHRGDFPEAERFFAMEASLPIFPSLSDKTVKYIAESVISTLSRAQSQKRKKAV